MRTTVSIDGDVLAAAHRNGFPVFKVPENAVPITPEHVKMLDDEV